MNVATRSITAVLIAVGLVALAPSVAHADTNLSGHWSADSLRMDGVGYSLSLSAASSPANAYDGVLLFHFQDGRVGKRIKVGVAQDGSKLTLAMPGGSLASGTKTLKGTVGQDGSIYFANCQKQFAYVTKATASQMCLFQEFSAR